MVKLTKRVVDAVVAEAKDYVLWDEELPGFGLRIFPTGKRSYLIQYRSGGRSRRYTIGTHGIWTPEAARREAKMQLARVAQGEDPAEDRAELNKAMSMKELCELYMQDLRDGLILGKGGRPKKKSTVDIDLGRIERHVIPLLGSRRVKDLTKAILTKVMRDIMAGKTRAFIKTSKLRGRANVRGGPGTAARTLGLIGGILTYAVDLGIIDSNPAHGIKRPKDNVRSRRLNDGEYRILGRMLKSAGQIDKFGPTIDIIRQIALTGCRRGEIINLKWCDVDLDGSCLRLSDSKEGKSVRPIGLPVVEFLEQQQSENSGTYVFSGPRGEDTAFGGFPNHWGEIFLGSPLEGVTPHVLRHSFASIGNDLGFTEVTIAALMGHAKGTVTSKYIHVLDAALIMAADTLSGYIAALLDGAVFKQRAYSLDRGSRKAALADFIARQEAPRKKAA
ncbi:tyrosine-type recombinase/integrase [Sphingopyxis granuli]|jgi:integrase|uniref:Phage integrase family protein n=1 Tax=Sphingopyxis granuli TaxID=267128 RepID=A0AA86GHF2_9SPHN|nr:tyrosine-type recombinase/integrase [Sphingopyxis granuli]AMG72545.1 Phage integrase family protein [Sphingopyxis granuli]